MLLLKRLFCALIEAIASGESSLRVSVDTSNVILNLNVNIQEQKVEQKVSVEVDVRELVKSLEELKQLLEFYMNSTRDSTHKSRYTVLKQRVEKLLSTLRHN